MENIESFLLPPETLNNFRDIQGGLTRGKNVGAFPKHQYNHVDYTALTPVLPLRVEFAGTDEVIAGCYRHITGRDLFSVELVLEGDMAFRQDGHTFHVKPGEFHLFQPFGDSIAAVGPSGRCVKRVVAMSGALLGEILSRLSLRSLNCLRPTTPAPLVNQMESICEMLSAPERDLSRLCGAAYALLVTMARQQEATGQPEELRRALEVLEDRLHGSLRLDQLARECGLSESSLWRLFKEQYDCGPIAYYINRKMQFAQHLLRHGGYLSIKEVAYSLGYHDPLYFSADFKKRIGCSPTAYRNQTVPQD